MTAVYKTTRPRRFSIAPKTSLIVILAALLVTRTFITKKINFYNENNQLYFYW
jgi:hypothetical protein